MRRTGLTFSGSRLRTYQSGIALISVIFIMTTVLILAFTFSFVVLSERRASASTVTINQSMQLADAASERARQTVIKAFNDNTYSVGSFLDVLREQKTSGGNALPSLKGVQTTTVDGVDTYWEIRDISEEGNTFGWVDIAATAETNQGSQTVIRRVGFGSSPIFELAMLTETVNCMFCHLQVNGDVGTLQHFRPGWGTDLGGNAPSNGSNDGWNSGGNQGGHGASKINGNVYAARTVTQDGSDGTINGAIVNGDVQENSQSSKLPTDVDGDGIPDFPPIRRDVARANARGSLSGGAVIQPVNFGSSLSSGSGLGNVGAINQIYEGNLVLVGTESSPIILDGDVYIDGDVVIKGVVKGKGAIYAGRNIYVAGDVTLDNPPDEPGHGVCASINPSSPNAENDCAKLNVKADNPPKDELRFGARGSIIIGDYTEYENGSLDSWSQRQSADYYRQQFGFESGKKYYDKATGDELFCSDGTCKNVDGDIISDYVSVNAKTNQPTDIDGDEAYDYSFRPGNIDSSGAFSSWMSDDVYKEFLGSETMTYSQWRWYTGGVSDAELKNELLRAVQDANLSISEASLNNAVATRASGGYVDLLDDAGNRIGKAHWSGKTIRVTFEAESTVETQVNAIDAFLYANQRIAGKVNMQALRINGGMIAKEIGVLAYGRSPGWPWNQYDSAVNCDEGTEYYVEHTQDCGMTVNYDYRLRNGGLGYNAVEGQIGKTYAWQLADKASDKVQP